MNASDINALESEAGVIASLIHKPELSFYSETLLPNHFVDKNNRLVYTAICELARRDIKTVDPYNIIEILNSSPATQRYAEELSIDKLQEMVEMSDVLTRESVEEYKVLANNVLDAAFRRDTFVTLRECQALCFDRNEEEVERKIYEKLDNVMLDFTSSSDIPQYSEVIDSMYEKIKLRQSGVTDAIQFPFVLMNEYVTMEPGEVVAFTAQQKGGKSAMLLTCAVDLLKKDKAVLYIDSELSTQLFTIRILSHLTGIKFNRIRSGGYGAEEAAVLDKAVAWLKTRKFIHLYMPTLRPDEMYLAAKKAKHLIGMDVIIVDYLKADSTKESGFEVYASLGQAAECLKNRIAGEMGVCGLTAAQATATGKIADSARIARSVSTVVTITDKTFEEIQRDGADCGTKKIRVQFNRNGAQMSENEWIDFDFDGSTVTYRQAARQHAVEEPY